MSMTDPIGDMLTRIRNGQRAGKNSVLTPASKMRERVLQVLEREGFIRGYSRADFERGKAELSIELKYHEGQPVIQQIKRRGAGSIRRSAIFRGSPTAWVSPSCRRPAA